MTSFRTQFWKKYVSRQNIEYFHIVWKVLFSLKKFPIQIRTPDSGHWDFFSYNKIYKSSRINCRHTKLLICSCFWWLKNNFYKFFQVSWQSCKKTSKFYTSQVVDREKFEPSRLSFFNKTQYVLTCFHLKKKKTLYGTKGPGWILRRKVSFFFQCQSLITPI